jgi:hypothetical protein
MVDKREERRTEAQAHEEKEMNRASKIGTGIVFVGIAMLLVDLLIITWQIAMSSLGMMESYPAVPAYVKVLFAFGTTLGAVGLIVFGIGIATE